MGRACIGVGSGCLPVLAFEPAHIGAGTGQLAFGGDGVAAHEAVEPASSPPAACLSRPCSPTGRGGALLGTVRRAVPTRATGPSRGGSCHPCLHTGQRRVNAAVTGYYLPQPADPRLWE